MKYKDIQYKSQGDSITDFDTLPLNTAYTISNGHIISLHSDFYKVELYLLVRKLEEE